MLGFFFVRKARKMIMKLFPCYINSYQNPLNYLKDYNNIIIELFLVYTFNIFQLNTLLIKWLNHLVQFCNIFLRWINALGLWNIQESCLIVFFTWEPGTTDFMRRSDGGIDNY